MEFLKHVSFTGKKHNLVLLVPEGGKKEKKKKKKGVGVITHKITSDAITFEQNVSL